MGGGASATASTLPPLDAWGGAGGSNLDQGEIKIGISAGAPAEAPVAAATGGGSRSQHVDEQTHPEFLETERELPETPPSAPLPPKVPTKLKPSPNENVPSPLVLPAPALSGKSFYPPNLTPPSNLTPPNLTPPSNLPPPISPLPLPRPSFPPELQPACMGDGGSVGEGGTIVCSGGGSGGGGSGGGLEFVKHLLEVQKKNSSKTAPRP